MRKIFLVLLIVPLLTIGQEAKICLNIKNSRAKNIEIVKEDYTKADRLFGIEKEITVPLTEGKAQWTYKLSNPIFVSTYYEDSLTNESYRYIFYLSPSDNLNFSFDSRNPETTYSVKGKGSNNNQPLIQKIINNPINLDAYKKDSLPGRVYTAIKERDRLNQKILKDYISINHPTKEFLRICSLYVHHFPMWTYLTFNGEQKFSIRNPYYRNEQHWQVIEDTLANVNSLNNNEILRIDEHDYFLSIYLTRIKERLWQHPELLKDYYNTTSQEEAIKVNDKDPENLLKEKIIEKHFTGKTAEFLYGVLFRYAINEKEDNLPEIFTRFKQKYPNSQYIPFIEPAILAIKERRKRGLTNEMVFVENNESFQTFDDVLKFVKGKTVLLDMWGTWCGPCRSEILLNSDSIKNHFKGKDLSYLYIANHDLGNENKWRELISYYNLKGTHILASNQLTIDIMGKVKREGFPTYVIIRKDGTFELARAGYPMDRNILITQLENALNN